jgi:hypothetical protein
MQTLLMTTLDRYREYSCFKRTLSPYFLFIAVKLKNEVELFFSLLSNITASNAPTNATENDCSYSCCSCVGNITASNAPTNATVLRLPIAGACGVVDEYAGYGY